VLLFVLGAATLFCSLICDGLALCFVHQFDPPAQEKNIELKNTNVTFSIWDLGGQQEYLHMLPLVRLPECLNCA
jgi:hypothetical protein